MRRRAYEGSTLTLAFRVSACSERFVRIRRRASAERANAPRESSSKSGDIRMQLEEWVFPYATRKPCQECVTPRCVDG